MHTRTLLGVTLILHGLAHAGPGMWAAGTGPIEPVAFLWWAAAMGFVLAGFRLLRWPAPRLHPVPLSLVAAAASVSLLLLVWLGWTSIAGIALDASLPWLVMRWTSVRPIYSADGNLVGGPAPERRRRRTGVARGVGLVLSMLFLAHLTGSILLRPWHMRWGTTAAERHATLPGDELVPDARYVMDHAIVIDAPVSAVWPWLAQLGQDCAGFYSYDWLERLFGARIHNANTVHREWQHREIGELLPATQAGYLGIFDKPLGWRVLRFEPESLLVLENWGVFVLHPVDTMKSILHVRMRGTGRPSLRAVPLAPLGLLAFEPAHFIMERGMLRGIRDRAERMARVSRVVSGQ